MTYVALLIALTACILDLRTGRIPNWLTFGGSAAGIATAMFVHGAAGAGLHLLGWTVGLAIFLPVFVLDGLGAGDVKLMACLGAWLGPIGVLWTALYAAMAGGVMALLVSVAAGYARQALRNIWTLLLEWFYTGIHPVPALTLEEGRGPRLAYALPIAAGALVTIWLRI
jgi:prepilin peptidase CpaA